MNIFYKKSIADIQKESQSSTLKKDLVTWDLIILGLAGIIGSGIFVVTGFAAANQAGPSIMVSFGLSALACIVTALAYSELASMLPTSGGAYTYVYITFGEIAAFLMGWNILLLYTLGSAAAAVGWSSYVTGILEHIHLELPHKWSQDFFQGGGVNVLAVFITLCITVVSIMGTKLMAKLNSFLVFAKLAAIFGFIVLALPHFEIQNWEPFMPKGIKGVFLGAGTIFLAFAGFDTIATAVEECKNPKKDIPIGIISSLFIAAALYITVSGMLTGICHFSELANAQPIAYALNKHQIHLGSKLVAIGALAALSTVIFSNLFGQARVLMVMGRDALAPSVLQKIHPTFRTPSTGLLLSGLIISIIGGIFPVEKLSQLMSMSALLMYTLVSLCVIILRVRYPQEKRNFQCPAVFLVAGSSFCICGGLFLQLFFHNIFIYTLFFIIGIVLYFLQKTFKR